MVRCGSRFKKTKAKTKPKPKTEKTKKNLKEETEKQDKPDWWYGEVGEQIRKEDHERELSEVEENLLLKRAVLMSELGMSFEELSTTTPREQDKLIEGWNILQEEKAEGIDEPDI